MTCAFGCARRGAGCARRENGPFETALVTYCAPALAGVKPANLFLYRPKGGVEAVRAAVGFWTEELAPRGIRVRVLRECAEDASCLVYLYREAWLGRILSDAAVLSFLRSCGYGGGGGTAALLRTLSGRLGSGGQFPHEIGVFLGYPLSDVVAFLENRGRNYAFCGCWKAYGDTDGARRCSERYRRCSLIYRRMFERGTPIQRLAVAV